MPVFEAILAVMPGINTMTLSALVDGMRAANRMRKAELFRFRIATSDGEPVEASNGFLIPADCAFSDAPAAGHVFLVASYKPARDLAVEVQMYLRKVVRHAPVLYGIDHGALLLAEAGLLDNRQATTHWEVMPSLQDLYPDVDFVEQLFVFAEQRVTCAGHTACVDLVATLIEKNFGADLATAVMQEMIYGRLRNGKEDQRTLDRGLAGAPPAVSKAVAFMKQNIEIPQPVTRVAERAGISRRQLEHGFQAQLGCSPARYYLRLRLSLGRQLLLYSGLLIVEISNACGFSSQGNFTRAFHREFGSTPSGYRKSFHTALDRPVMPFHPL